MMTTAEIDLLARERHYDLRAEAVRGAAVRQASAGLTARARRAVVGAVGAILSTLRLVP